MYWGVCQVIITPNITVMMQVKGGIVKVILATAEVVECVPWCVCLLL